MIRYKGYDIPESEYELYELISSNSTGQWLIIPHKSGDDRKAISFHLSGFFPSDDIKNHKLNMKKVTKVIMSIINIHKKTKEG